MDGFRHEALFYAGEDDFFEHVLPFVRAGVAHAEPTRVMVGGERLRLLREALGDDAWHVELSDIDIVGHNPARVLPAWQRFVDAHAGTGRKLRGVAEPLVAWRSPAERDECAIHDALLNVAFARCEAWSLVCAYDTATLDADTITRARYDHPMHWTDGVHEVVPASDGDRGAFERLDAATLPEPKTVLADLAFDEHTALDRLRTAIAVAATHAGFDPLRREQAVLAVHEMATNSLRHGGGRGVLRVWMDGDALVCEVRDGGRLGDPLAGLRRPDATRTDGRGLWIANQLCDLVQIRQGDEGLVVRAHLRPLSAPTRQLRTSNVITPT